MNVLVTGGCGFIGTNLLPALCEAGHRVRVLDNLSAAVLGSPPLDDVELKVCDIQDQDAVYAATSGMDVVVHLAAQTSVIGSQRDPIEDCRVNTLGTLYLLDACRRNGVRRFVFASSNAPVGDVEPPVDETRAPRPASPYGASKLAGEGYCAAFWGSFGLETVALRFANVYGPWSGHKTSVVAQFVRDVLERDELTIYGDGGQTRDFIHVSDLVGAVLAAMSSPQAAGELLQIGTGRETTVQRIAELVTDALGRSNVRVVRRAGRPGEVRRSVTKIERARRLLDWHPGTLVTDGIPATCRWFLAQQ